MAVPRVHSALVSLDIPYKLERKTLVYVVFPGDESRLLFHTFKLQRQSCSSKYFLPGQMVKVILEDSENARLHSPATGEMEKILLAGKCVNRDDKLAVEIEGHLFRVHEACNQVQFGSKIEGKEVHVVLGFKFVKKVGEGLGVYVVWMRTLDHGHVEKKAIISEVKVFLESLQVPTQYKYLDDRRVRQRIVDETSDAKQDFLDSLQVPTQYKVIDDSKVDQRDVDRSDGDGPGGVASSSRRAGGLELDRIGHLPTSQAKDIKGVEAGEGITNDGANDQLQGANIAASQDQGGQMTMVDEAIATVIREFHNARKELAMKEEALARKCESLAERERQIERERQDLDDERERHNEEARVAQAQRNMASVIQDVNVEEGRILTVNDFVRSYIQHTSDITESVKSLSPKEQRIFFIVFMKYSLHTYKTSGFVEKAFTNAFG